MKTRLHGYNRFRWCVFLFSFSLFSSSFYTNICLACFHFVKIHIWCTFDFLSSPFSVWFFFFCSFWGVQWRNYLNAPAKWIANKMKEKKIERRNSELNLNMNGIFGCPWIEKLKKLSGILLRHQSLSCHFSFHDLFFPSEIIRLECLQQIKWINWLRREC